MKDIAYGKVFSRIIIAFIVALLPQTAFAQCSSWPVVMYNICENSAIITLSGGTPSPGVYTVNGVISTTFDPAAAGTGTHLLTYKANSCSNTVSQAVTVKPKPVITFLSTPLPTPNPPPQPDNIVVNINSGDSVYLKCSSIPSIKSTQFSPYIRVTQITIDQAYLHPSDNTVYSITVIDVNDCSVTGTVDVRVKKLCNASYSKVQAVDSNKNLVPGHIVITDLSTGSNLFYYWDFGDGTSSIKVSPTHTYTGNGPYNLCLTVSDGTCTDSYCDSIKIDSNGIIMRRPPGMTIHVGGYNPSTAIEKQETSNIDIYPNPSYGKLIVDLGQNYSEVNIELSNIFGQKVNSWSFNQIHNTELKLQFEKGLYFLKIDVDDNSSVYRVVRK